MGILKNFLVSMVNRRTKAVIDIAKHNPVLEEQTKQLDKSIEKLEESIAKAKVSSDKAGGSDIGKPFRDMATKLDEKYGGKY